MKLRKYTQAQIYNIVACTNRWTPYRIKKNFGTAKKLSLRQICELPILAIDAIWVIAQLGSKGLPLKLAEAAYSEFWEYPYSGEYDPKQPLSDKWDAVYEHAAWGGTSNSYGRDTRDTNVSRAVRDYLYAQLRALEKAE